MATVVFLHGLNTFGDSLVHVGPLTFGHMHDRLQRALGDKGIDLIAVPGIGRGPIEEQAATALDFLSTHQRLQKGEPFDLLGQSTGGLVARVLSHDPDLMNRIESLITIGTPHLGAEIASFGLDFPSRFPHLHRVFCAFGYDTSAKTIFFEHFTENRLKAFNEKYPTRSELPSYSLLCEVEGSDISLPLKGLGLLNGGATLARGDAFIRSESQVHGEVIGPFALDHFAQLGVLLHSSAKARRKAQNEFARLVRTLTILVSKQVSLVQDTVNAPKGK